MRYIAFILLFFTACTKQDIEQPRERITDDFGLRVFNTVKRARQDFQAPVLTFNKPVATQDGTPINVILLDFDGHEFANTNWNVGGAISVDYSGLTPLEKYAIVDSVTKDFKYQFCTITTDESLYNRCNPMRRQRIVLTESWQWYGQAGGVAYRNSFTWGDNTPAFVFTTLLNYNLKFIQEAVSHEIGHTLGLRHQSKWIDGRKVNEYNYGTEEKAPIMGCSYYANRGEWNIGTDAFGNIQYDGRRMEETLGGKYDGQGNFKPYGTY